MYSNSTSPAPTISTELLNELSEIVTEDHIVECSFESRATPNEYDIQNIEVIFQDDGKALHSSWQLAPCEIVQELNHAFVTEEDNNSSLIQRNLPAFVAEVNQFENQDTVDILEDQNSVPSNRNLDALLINQKNVDISVAEGNVTIAEDTPDINTVTGTKNNRKRKRNPSNWKQNVRKSKRQRGESYVDSKGNLQEERKIKEKLCHSAKCVFECQKKITYSERLELHKQFWLLSDELKSHFYSKHVKRSHAKRKRTQQENSKKSYSYEYFFEIHGVQIRVCQEFFLNTLSISKQRVYYFFKHIQDATTNIPRALLAGKHTKKITSEEKKQEVRSHIESFPAIESHYCRASTKKKYLDRGLNLTRMYNLYIPCVEEPVSFQTYSNIFNYEYNIGFFKPKKDLCDRCEEFKVTKNASEEQQLKQREHERKKVLGNNERQSDRIRYKNDHNEATCVVTYDLQNVFPLPKANVGHYYYRSKLNCYNLTNKTVYNAIWHEYINGRGGTHIASALIKIMKAVVADNPHLTKIILWSDSCVPQNRNSIMSFALQHFLASASSKNLQCIEQKYSEPGHGNVQEIDSAHSCIERYVKHLEIWTPITLIRILMHMPTTWKMAFKVLQMRPSDYLNYQQAAKSFPYKLIPYTKVKHIIYNKEFLFNVKYRESFAGEINEAKLLATTSRNRSKDSKNLNFDFPKEIDLLTPENVGITADKHHALQLMLPQMPEEEKPFYRDVILNLKIKRTDNQNKARKEAKKPTASLKLKPTKSNLKTKCANNKIKKREESEKPTTDLKLKQTKRKLKTKCTSNQKKTEEEPEKLQQASN